MFINRGNHEAKEMNRAYGFEGEAKHKHGELTYKVRLFTCIYVTENNLAIVSRFILAIRTCFYSAYVSSHSLELY